MKKLAGIVAVLLVLGYTALNLGSLLVRNDTRAEHYPVAVILMGSHLVPRVQTGIDLYKAGTVDKLVFFHTKPSELEDAGLALNDGAQARTLLQSHGVQGQAAHYVLDTNVASTRDEAEATLAWLEHHAPDVKRIAVITSWYHTSRAGYTFDKAFRGTDIKVDVVPAFGKADPVRWWKEEDSFLAVFTEELKWLYYLIPRGN